MAKRGRVVAFHGAFGTKAAARRKERSLRRRGSHPYVERKRMRGGVRYLVLTRRRGR